MYHRKKWGRGFAYTTASGKFIKDKKLIAWFKSLVIPPAWTEVEISEKKSARCLVTGRDEKGRKQYIYNPKYVEKKNREKFDRIINFADSLEHMRRVTGQHMREKELTKDKVLATMVRIMDQAYFRPGSQYYTKENDTYGLTTLRSRHVEIENEKITFSYVGKSGKEQERQVFDKRIAEIVKQLDETPGYRVFKYFDEEGEKHNVNSDDLNAYIHEVMGEEFSAKDFRTWAGTMIAAIALDEMGAVKEKDQKKMDKNIREAVVRVSEILGNTPAVARSSYIDPRIIEDYIDGKTIRFFQKDVAQLLKNSTSLSVEEISVLYMLKSSLKQ